MPPCFVVVLSAVALFIVQLCLCLARFLKSADVLYNVPLYNAPDWNLESNHFTLNFCLSGRMEYAHYMPDKNKEEKYM